MNPNQLSIAQSLKIFWSFLWRGWVLAIPVGIAYTLVMFLLAPSQNTVEGVVNLEPTKAYLGIVSMFGAVFVGLIVQAFAMRWALGAKWSDFRITAVPTGHNQV